MSHNLVGRTADLRPMNQLFDALSHHYRRRVLVLLNDHNRHSERALGVEDLATEDDEPELLKRELHHTHLPKLDEAGYIEWDDETQTFWKGPMFDEIAPLLRQIDDHQDELPGGWP